MRLLFTPEALDSFNRLKSQNSRESDQVRDIIKDILAHPSTGRGNPMALLGALSGLWSRNYGVFRQIIYAFNEESVKIFAIGKNLIQTEEPSTVPLQQTQYSEEEYRNVLSQMEANRGKGEIPKVGIF